MTLYPYPTEVPTRECIDLVIAALRGTPDVKESLHAAWAVAGYALAKYDRHPPLKEGSRSYGEADAMFDLGLLAETGPAKPSAVPWDLLLPVLLRLLEKLLRK